MLSPSSTLKCFKLSSTKKKHTTTTSGLALAPKVSLISAQALSLAAERDKSRLETFLNLLIAKESAASAQIRTP